MTKWMIVGATAAIALASMGAPAAVAAPPGGFAVFAQCPTHAKKVGGCLYAHLEGGYITLGKALMPIAKTVVLQGGLVNISEVTQQLAAAVGGETMTKAEQMIPGGLFGSPLGAVTELAGPASAISLESGLFGGTLETILRLPVKVRLVNPLLGGECAIGSDSHPIELSLRTGTSGGLTGSRGRSMSLERGRILLLSGVSMVSSGFALPQASGCGLTVVDEAIDAKLGLPASKNTAAIFDMKMEIANSELVEESEG